MAEKTHFPVLELKGLTKQIKQKTIVNNLSFSLQQGDIYGFLGPNGSGKTTTLRMITRLVFPTSGEIYINGHSVDRDYRKALSVVGSIIENPAFYLDLTAKQNVKLSAELSDTKVGSSRVDEVLEIVGLSDVKNDKVKTFSLGMKQRLGLANALLCRPAIIILDEPTNGVDPAGLREMKELIKRLSQQENITFLISSHMLREMQDLCNRVTILQKGKLVETGLVHELLKDYGADNLEDLFFACIKEDRQ
jgi:ABC-type multidrug transport system, ATPase component